MSELAYGPPEVLWLDEAKKLEHFTGRTPRTILRDFAPAGLAVYERNGRRFLLHSEYIAFLKATSTKRKEGTSHDQEKRQEQDHAARFRRDERGQLAGLRRSG